MRWIAAAVALLAVVLSGCSAVDGTGEGGYISGNGQVQTIAVAERGEPLELSGDTLRGETLDVADLRGTPVVINVWGSWCAPCREEAPLLQRTHEQLKDQVAFVGVNTRDGPPANGIAFERHFGITYPSIHSRDGTEILALGEHVALRALPVTAVLDEKGRVAAIIRGVIPSQTTLEGVIEDASVSGFTAPSKGAA